MAHTLLFVQLSTIKVISGQDKGLVRGNIMRTTFIFGILAAAALGLCACNSEPTKVPAATVAPTSFSVSPESASVARIGETVKFDVGLAVTVQSGGFVKASETAYGAVGGKIAVIKIVLKNESKKPISAGGISNFELVAGESGARKTFAADVGIDNPTFGTILPGETLTGVFGFGLAAKEAQKIQIEMYDPDSSGSVQIRGSIP